MYVFYAYLHKYVAMDRIKKSNTVEMHRNFVNNKIQKVFLRLWPTNMSIVTLTAIQSQSPSRVIQVSCPASHTFNR